MQNLSHDWNTSELGRTQSVLLLAQINLDNCSYFRRGVFPNRELYYVKTAVASADYPIVDNGLNLLLSSENNPNINLKMIPANDKRFDKIVGF